MHRAAALATIAAGPAGTATDLFRLQSRVSTAVERRVPYVAPAASELGLMGAGGTSSRAILQDALAGANG